MAEGNPTEFLIENTEDKQFIDEFILFMNNNKSQYYITDNEVNELRTHLYDGANNQFVGGYFGVRINMNLAQYKKSITSQDGEDGILEYLINNFQINSKFDNQLNYALDLFIA
mgnify:CR=1 FL=1